MCRVVSCSTCGKSTWKGCGEHADEVMAAVPDRDRCRGHAVQEIAVSDRPANIVHAIQAPVSMRLGNRRAWGTHRETKP